MLAVEKRRVAIDSLNSVVHVPTRAGLVNVSQLITVHAVKTPSSLESTAVPKVNGAATPTTKLFFTKDKAISILLNYTL